MRKDLEEREEKSEAGPTKSGGTVQETSRIRLLRARFLEEESLSSRQARRLIFQF